MRDGALRACFPRPPVPPVHTHMCATSCALPPPPPPAQYLESYAAHMGPVYSLQWSPFRRDMFISCSADWTLKMWQEGREQPLLSFQSTTSEVRQAAGCVRPMQELACSKAGALGWADLGRTHTSTQAAAAPPPPVQVNDVQWCPTNATVFGSVTSSGRLEVWDFDLSTVKPVVTHKAGAKLSCLLFSPICPVVVCGSATGHVSVFRWARAAVGCGMRSTLAAPQHAHQHVHAAAALGRPQHT